MTLTTLQSGMGWFPQQAGGLNRMYYNLMHHLPAAGVGVRGLVAGTPFPANGTTIDTFSPSETLLPLRWLRARQSAQRALTESAPDLIASHFALYTHPWIDLIGARPFVVHFHGPWALEGAVETSRPGVAWIKGRVEKRVYRRADHFIVLSTAFREILHEQYGIAWHRISVVPGGVDVAAFDSDLSPAEARERLQWPTDRPIILAVRRLARRMGLENLIDAMTTVTQRVPDALLLIAGKGPRADALQRQIDDRGLQDHVRLLGFVPEADLPLAYRAASVSIVPTVALEGFGLTTIESLAAGTPVLVTPIGGLPEVVRDLSADLILRDASQDALSDGLIRALTASSPLPDPRACTAYARHRFDWPTIAKQTRAVYTSVLATHV